MCFVFVRCIATFFVYDETDAVGPWSCYRTSGADGVVSCYRTSGADGVVLFGSTVFMEFGISFDSAC